MKTTLLLTFLAIFSFCSLSLKAQNLTIQNQNNALISMSSSNVRLDSIVKELWKESTNEWIPARKGVFNYNTDLTAELVFSNRLNVAVDSNWYTTDKHNFTADTVNSTLEDIKTISFLGNNNWNPDPLSKKVYNVNSDNKIESVFFHEFNPDSNAWILSSKTDFEYNADGLEISNVFYSWNEMNSIWIEEIKEDFRYNSNNLVDTILVSYWNSTEWQLGNYKTELEYSTDNLLTELRVMRKDALSPIYSAHEKNIYSYDANQNVDTLSMFEYDFTSNTWEPVRKYINSVDLSKDFIPLNLPVEEYDFITDNKMKFVNKLNHIIRLDWIASDSVWYKESKLVFNFTEQNLNINERNNVLDFNVFPNPFVSDVFVNSKYINLDIEIININGARVLTLENSSNQALDLSYLPAGVYFMKVQNEHKFGTIKIVKR
ncbi:MAG: T9SS type A sorting domain-containing protein [Flavobacteriales bacterium]